jgi:hypothetical protein
MKVSANGLRLGEGGELEVQILIRILNVQI